MQNIRMWKSATSIGAIALLLCTAAGAALAAASKGSGGISHMSAPRMVAPRMVAPQVGHYNIPHYNVPHYNMRQRTNIGAQYYHPRWHAHVPSTHVPSAQFKATNVPSTHAPTALTHPNVTTGHVKPRPTASAIDPKHFDEHRHLVGNRELHPFMDER